jgi:hypothetical protein
MPPSTSKRRTPHSRCSAVAFVRSSTPLDHLNKVAVRVSQSADEAEWRLLNLTHPCDVLTLQLIL